MQHSHPTTPARILPSALIVPGAMLFVVGLGAFLLLKRAVGFDSYDLEVYLTGGDNFMHGLAVYDVQLHGTGTYFIYPPITLLVFGPLSVLPFAVVEGVLFGLGVVALWAVVWLTFRMLGFGPGAGLVGASLGVLGCALWLHPVNGTLDVGQINILLMFLVVADFAVGTRFPRLAGILIGVATAIKITPAIFILYLLLTRRFRAALNATLTFSALTGLGFLVAPAESARYWFGGMIADTARLLGPIPVGDVSNQSINGIASRFFGESGGVVWLVLALAIGIGGLAVAVKADRCGDPVAGMLACAITGLLISPVSWHEHWIWVVPVGVWLGATALRLGSRKPVLAGALLSPLVVFLAWPQESAPGAVRPTSILDPADSLWDEGSRNPIVALVGTAYVSVGVLILAVGAWILFRPNSGMRTVEFAHSQSPPAAISDR
ncbi:glycosyltransferase 87 family protein [Rhodococcus olei]|uniref:Glycosyltransferase 87 family protein n=1 Tax=Rhodococcus olei TaxID=2161675 RepID=A0ABP8NQL1_9NOCA